MAHVIQPCPVAVANLESGQRRTSSAARCQSLFRRIEQSAREAATVRCQRTSDGLHLIPNRPGGLPISVFTCEGRLTVCFGGWYDEIDDAPEAAELIDKAVRGMLRLAMKGDGRSHHTFAVEMREDDGHWREVSRMETAFLFRQKPVRDVTYLCNGPSDTQVLENASFAQRYE